LWEKWGAAADDGYTLIIDFKTPGDELVQAVKQMLEPHRELLSSLAKSNESQFQPRKITVCFTGNGALNYDAMIPEGGEYLGFTDNTGCPTTWQADVSRYVPQRPARFARFISLDKQNFMDRPESRTDDHLSIDRLKRVAELAQAGGYRFRVYTVNPRRQS